MIDESMDSEQGGAPAPASAEKSGTEPRALDVETAVFRREGGRLQVRDDGGEWRDVSALRLFPLSEPDRWISIIDGEHAEIGLITDLRDVGADQREMIEEELRRRYLTPVITEIISIRHRYDTSEWTVETDRGPAVFIMRNIREKVKEPLPRHLTLEDAEGNRFDIPDIEALDPASRRWLDQEI